MKCYQCDWRDGRRALIDAKNRDEARREAFEHGGEHPFSIEEVFSSRLPTLPEHRHEAVTRVAGQAPKEPLQPFELWRRWLLESGMIANGESFKRVTVVIPTDDVITVDVERYATGHAPSLPDPGTAKRSTSTAKKGYADLEVGSRVIPWNVLRSAIDDVVKAADRSIDRHAPTPNEPTQAYKRAVAHLDELTNEIYG